MSCADQSNACGVLSDGCDSTIECSCPEPIPCQLVSGESYGLCGKCPIVMVSRAPNIVRMDTGPNISGVEWTNPGQARQSDDLRAVAKLAQGRRTVPLVASDFRFAIPPLPAEAIRGIRLVIEKSKFGPGRIEDSSVQLLRQGTPAGQDKYQITPRWKDTDTETFYGGPDVLWNLSWTPGELNHLSTGVVIRAINKSQYDNWANARIDAITLQVFHDDPACAASP